MIRAHDFRPRGLVGGHVVIDLINTVTARNADPIDWLDGFPRLLEWAELTGVFEPGAVDALRRRSEAHPRAASLALHRTRELRETLHEVLSALPGVKPHRRTPSAVWKPLGRAPRSGAAWTFREDTRTFTFDDNTSGLEHLNDELSLRSFELLQTLPVDRTRLCPRPRCGWLFIDRSNGGRRRWCDMPSGRAVDTGTQWDA